MLCALFKAYLVLGTPRAHLNQFDVVAIIHLADLKVEIAEDSKGEVFEHISDLVTDNSQVCNAIQHCTHGK